jgi:hypothetical protein
VEEGKGAFGASSTDGFAQAQQAQDTTKRDARRIIQAMVSRPQSEHPIETGMLGPEHEHRASR